MSSIYLQIASEYRAPTVALARRHRDIAMEVSDDELWDLVLADIAATLSDYFDHWRRRGQQEPTEGSWVFLHSNRSAEHRPVRLGYEILLQQFQSALPAEPDDVIQRVQGAPEWLNRVIVVPWHTVPADSSVD